MRGAGLPTALICAALGLALAFAPRRAWVPSLLIFLATLKAFSILSLPPSCRDAVLYFCWLSVIATAASVHLVRGLTPAGALALSANAGVWASAVVSLSGSRLNVMEALPCLLILAPAAWVIERYNPVPVKVVSSWLIAIAVLAASLPLVPVTPGYLPDHME